MILNFNVFSLILISAGLLTFYMSLSIFKKLGGAVYSFGYIMGAIALWAISYGIELSCTSLDAMLFWVNVEYLGIATLPALWMVFVLTYIGKKSRVTGQLLAGIFSIPVITILLVWTNSLHHLHYTSVSVSQVDNYALLDIVPGVWYQVFTIYFYVMLAMGIYFLVRQSRFAPVIYRKQYRTIIASALIPWAVNLLYLLGLRPLGHIDLTPFAFICTALIIAVGLQRYQLFDIVPVARGKVMEAMQEGVLIIDVLGRVVDANIRMKQILGKKAGEVIGRNIRELQITAPALELFSKRADSEKIDIELGDGRFYSVTITSLYEEKEYSGQLLLFRDVTERKHFEQNLESLNMLKDRLFSIISHDLRSPLNTLMNILSLTNEGHITEKELKEMLPEISKNLGYTTNLVNNLLQWSKSQLKGETIHPVQFDAYNTIQEMLPLMQNQAAAKQITIINRVQQGALLYADEPMIQGVLRNLLSNAIKFSQLKGTITLSSVTDAAETTVCIADEGVGIAPDDLQKLFGVENFTTRGTINEQGTGLGLLLCKDFVERNNGHIWAESEPGKGSRFYFSLPAWV